MGFVCTSESGLVVKLVDLKLSSADIRVNPDQVVSVERIDLSLKYSDPAATPVAQATVVTLATGKQIKLNRTVEYVTALLGAGS